MPKEWILNSAINRWGLQKTKMVGRVAEEIRRCAPKTVEDWENYYYKNVRSKEHLEDIGRKLYVKISEVLRAEIDDVTEEECICYVINLVIQRTFDGYITEKKTIYEQLQDILGVKIESAPDEWDRNFNVDFFIKIKDKYIGLQIKPAGYAFIPQIINEKNNQIKTHERFTELYGGKVFYVISVKDGDKKRIYNEEVIEDIRQEIKRLENT